MGSMIGWIIVGIIAILLLILLFVLVPWAKGQYIKDAYRLLKKSNPNPGEIRDTIKELNKYVGRWSKDEEIKELIKRLMNRLE